MGIFIRELGITRTFRRSNIMFSGNEGKFKRKKSSAAEEKSSRSPATDAKFASGAFAAPNLYPSTRPRPVIHKKTIKAKMLNLNQPTLAAIDKHGSANGNDKTLHGWKAVSSAESSDRGDLIADDNLLLTNIQHSLSSIHLKQSDIQSNLWRMMRTRCATQKMPLSADGDRARESPLRNEMQPQTSDDCQCCYHDENHHYDYDLHQLPGKLVNFIVLIAIFLHYAIIAFIEPNYFDWFSFMIVFPLSWDRIDGVSQLTLAAQFSKCTFSWNQSICSTSPKLIDIFVLYVWKSVNQRYI